MGKWKHATALRLAALTALGLSAVSSIARATTIPYSDNFTTYTTGTLPANVTTVDQAGYNATWSLTTATNSPTNNNGNFTTSLNYNNTSAGTDAVYQMTGVPNSAGSTFTESATFTAPGAGDPILIGLGALGSSSTLVTSSGNDYVFADINTSTGGTRLFVNEIGTGGSQTSNTGQASESSLSSSNTYTESLSGSYTSGGNLSLTFTVYDGVTLIDTLNYTVSATGAPSGSYFGLRDNGAGGASYGGSANVVYQNYSIAATPEPASLGLVALATLAGLARRRR